MKETQKIIIVSQLGSEMYKSIVRIDFAMDIGKNIK